MDKQQAINDIMAILDNFKVPYTTTDRIADIIELIDSNQAQTENFSKRDRWLIQLTWAKAMDAAIRFWFELPRGYMLQVASDKLNEALIKAMNEDLGEKSE